MAAVSPVLFMDLPLDSSQCVGFCPQKGFGYNPAHLTPLLGYNWLISAFLNISGQHPCHTVRCKAHVLLIS